MMRRAVLRMTWTILLALPLPEVVPAAHLLRQLRRPYTVHGGEGEVVIGQVSTIGVQRTSGGAVPVVRTRTPTGEGAASMVRPEPFFGIESPNSGDFRPKFDLLVEAFAPRYGSLLAHILAAGCLVLGYTGDFRSPLDLYDTYRQQPEHIFARPAGGLPALDANALDAIFRDYFEGNPDPGLDLPKLEVVVQESNGRQTTTYHLADGWRKRNGGLIVLKSNPKGNKRKRHRSS